MLEQPFTSIYGASESLMSVVGTGPFLVCCLASILLGAAAACVYMFRHDYSKNFVVTLALLPLIVQMVITLVNGNLGAGIAVMGVFNLVRFRSIPGSAKDIGSVFMAMAIGLATGMGFLTLAVLFTVIVAIMNIVLTMTPFGTQPLPPRRLKIVVPESLDYENLFEETLSKYTSQFELVKVSTSNMGSLFELSYEIHMLDGASEKEMIDELRTLNGNLKIVLSMKPEKRNTL